jgi:hypothetical protein
MIKSIYQIIVNGKLYRVRSCSLVNADGISGLALDLRNVKDDNDQISGTIPLAGLVQKGMDDEHLIQFQF